MKRYIFLFIGLLSGYFGFAQNIDSPNVDIYFAIDIVNGPQRFNISANGGTFTLIYALRDADLSRADVVSTLSPIYENWWITLYDVIHPEDYWSDGQLVFYVEPNPNSETRMGLFGINECDILIVQEPLPATYSIVNPAIQHICPEEDLTITLNGSDPNRQYQLFRNNVYCSSVAGTGDSISFQISDIGVYTIKDDEDRMQNGSVEVLYYQLFEDVAYLELDENSVVSDPNIVVNDTDFNVNFSDDCSPVCLDFRLESPLDSEQLTELVEKLNSGKVPWWDKAVSIAAYYGPGEYNGLFVLTVKDVHYRISYDVPICFRYYDKVLGPLYISKEPIIDIFKVTGTRIGNDGIDIHLSGSEQHPKYLLYNDGKLLAEQQGTGRPLVFEHRKESGTFTVKAKYEYDCTDMDGAVEFLNLPNLSSDLNWVYTKQYTVPDGSNCIKTIKYYDGLGRELQTRSVTAGGGGEDIVFPAYYDAAGRQSRSYLPYSIMGSFDLSLNGLAEHDCYYKQKYRVNHYAYFESEFDNTPEDNNIAQINPGSAFRTGAIKKNLINIRKNISSDSIKKYVVVNDLLNLAGLYASGTLIVREQTDPEGKTFREYYDVNDELICKKQEGLATYYVYDAINLLRYIVPPSQDGKSLSDWSKWCYRIDYDDQARAYKQYIPGAGYTITLYDKRNRSVLTQDALQRAKGQWAFTKYDVTDRPLITGVCGGTENDHVAALESQSVFGETRGTSLHGYTNASYPTSVTTADCLNVTYYDDYGWAGQRAVAFSPEDAFDVEKSDAVKGLVTGQKTKVLGVETDRWLTSALYYDRNYNTIQSVAELFPEGLEVTSNIHDFIGNPTRINVKQTIGTLVTEYDKDVEYDSQARILSVKQQIAGDTQVTLAEYVYDDLGRVSVKYLHNRADSVRYTYDMLGRNTGISSSQFSYELGFESVAPEMSTSVVPHFDGNISYAKWGTGNQLQRAYSYTYDNCKQLLAANYLEESGGVWRPMEKFAEKGMVYTPNGNISSLQRNDSDGARLHDIIYNYADTKNGNAVSSVVMNGESSDVYDYDAVGNMVYDGRRKVSIEYNLLNLPQRIFGDSGEVSYIYTGSGQKLATRANGSLTFYCDPIVYEGSESFVSRVLYMQHPEGMALRVSDNWVYYYMLKDQVGSTRALCRADGSRLISETTTDYYPFGLSHEYNDLHLNRFLFSGKELQDQIINGQMLGLYDFGSRFYDPVLGHWFNIDPSLQLTNPYGFCMNSPIAVKDPDGEFFIIDSFVFGFFRGLFKGENPFKSGAQAAKNDIRIWGGLFQGSFGDVISRLTWQLPQTLAGFTTAQVNNLFWTVESVNYYDGATVLKNRTEGWGAFTLSSYIIGSNSIEADPDNALFQHEYGHYLQSKASGPMYLFKYAIPSVWSAAKSEKSGWNHDYFAVEQDANARALKHWEKKFPGFTDNKRWDSKNNPIIGFNFEMPYNNIENQNALKNSKIQAFQWGDLWRFPLNMPVLSHGYFQYHKKRYTNPENMSY
ncbi:MAG: RHS repeat-associated core domain-containing protein [Alistipes sp.]|nr:RHS repeat-associated core domain-containing protein [Alistipes sp.]